MSAVGSKSEYINGLVAYKGGDYKTAFEMWTIAAGQGNAEAQFGLGAMYDNGQGVGQDYNQALSWYRKAADQGNAQAQVNLGLKYSKGEGVPHDYNQSVLWFRKAANQGNSIAQFSLGAMCENGQGLAQNYDQAALWYKKAAVQGNTLAQFNLGLMYCGGKGVTQDYVEALKWFTLAAAYESEEKRRAEVISFRDDFARAMTAEHRAEAERRAIDDPMFDPNVADIIHRVIEWREKTRAVFDEMSQKYVTRSRDTEHDIKPETYDETTKTELAKSIQEMLTFYGLHSKYEETMGRLSRFLNENGLVQNSGLPKVAWWQKLEKLFEIEGILLQAGSRGFRGK